MKALQFYDAETIDELVWPENYQQITEESPALAIFTDFETHQPLVIDASVKASDAEQHMYEAHVRLKLVVDKNNTFLGVVALEDLDKQEVMKKVVKGHQREDLRVTDMMRPKQDLKVIDYEELKHAHVSDVIAALRRYGHQHCIVVDRERHQIRGLVSASDIARKLKIQIPVHESPKFTELYLAAVSR